MLFTVGWLHCVCLGSKSLHAAWHSFEAAISATQEKKNMLKDFSLYGEFRGSERVEGVVSNTRTHFHATVWVFICKQGHLDSMCVYAHMQRKA